MADGTIVAAALVVLLMILPAMVGLVFERARAHRSRAEMLMTADKTKARATLAYYNDVHDSHSG